VDVVLRCEDLTRRFGDRVAVDGLSLTIAAGETYGLPGPNGAGKTTTIRMVCGLLHRDSGSVHIGDLEASATCGPRVVGARVVSGRSAPGLVA
jgi:ABC-2 type transport system ATP-binding protein